MTNWLSEPVETLLLNNDYPFEDPEAQSRFRLQTDVLVIGSGYGAAMAALALLEPDRQGRRISQKLWVFERGNEYVPDDFPKTMADLPGLIGTDRINPAGLWDVRAGDGVVTITGRGIGGTSLVNANVAARPAPDVVDRWPSKLNSTPWSQRLATHYPKLEKLLGVSVQPDVDHSVSFRALRGSADRLGSVAAAAPVTINFSGPTEHSADHEPCNLCGNCVMGCHSGAKGSLNMNAWPLAKQLGAALYSGVTVSSIQRSENGRWLVQCHVSARDELALVVDVGHVIVAAGTLGSTEILSRSRDKHGLALSSQLGKRFSTNGDALVFAAGQNAVVSQDASIPGEQPPASQPGPTISGMAMIDLADPQGSASAVTLEDAVIPYALREVWQEMLVSQLLLRRFADGAVSAWHHNNQEHDPLARSKALGEHSQALLIMGLDESNGELAWEGKQLRPVWRRDGSSDYFKRLDERFRSDEKTVFDGGLFAQNMVSQPLPPGFEGVVEGADELAGQLLSVHPLGGCAMAESAETGVVNELGQVFCGESGEDVYEHLYVLDGAIIPDAIGTNPLLTIAAVSYELAGQLRSMLPGDSVSEAGESFPPLQETHRKIPPGALKHIPVPSELSVEADFSERMVLHLSDSKRSMFPWSRPVSVGVDQLNRLFSGRLSGIDRLPETTRAMALDVVFSFSGEQSLDKWLESPRHPLPAAAVLSMDTVGGILTTADAHLTQVLELKGEVRLGAFQSVGRVRQALRTVSAILRYLRYRGMDLWVRLPKGLARWLLPARTWQLRYGESAQSVRKEASILKEIRTFWRIGSLQAERRYLEYEFKSANGVVISGHKTLAYGLGLPDLLKGLLVLPVTISAGSRSLKAALELDVQRITNGPSVMQVTRSPNLPTSVLAMGGFAMYFLRMIMSTHFWSFGAPSYEHFAVRRQLETSERQGRFYEPPEVIYYGRGGAGRSTPREKYERAGFRNGKPSPVSRLVRYQPGSADTAGRRSILLVHGLAHSSRVFWTDTIACNFVQYFLDNNYDVWILDHRVSANYVREVDPAHTWDDIARNDIPWAVTTVFNQINRLSVPGQERGVHIFSHCIGAGAVAMAVLGGHLNHEYRSASGDLVKRSMVASLVPHAVTPWLTTSGENRTRANLWSLVKEFDPIRIIEPLPMRNPGPLEMIYDRLAALAVTADERRQWSSWREYRDWRGPGFARTIYTRYTIFWGRQWHNANITKDTRYEFAGMIGPVPIGVIQQVYFSLTRGLLADNDGGNSYVKTENFARHWTFPTLFLHGNRNTVFDMESSRHSADQLTRLRMQGSTGQWPAGQLRPTDYARQKVWIEMLDDYGHMDMIFSKSAARDVYPRLHEFFVSADRDNMEEHYANRCQSEASLKDFQRRCASNSHPLPPATLLTGPIISSPRKRNGSEWQVTIWGEAQDYTAQSPSAMSVVHDQVVTQSHQHLDHEFWRNKVVVSQDLKSPMHLRLDYDGVANDNHDVHRRTALHWQQLPWFRRLQESSGPDPRPLTLLLGSCLYPGMPFDRDLAMSIFSGMAKHIPDQTMRGADSVLLLGDQIYADATANLFDPKVPYERFRNPYRTAFGHRFTRQLFSQIPVYFAVDDHEFRDNWRGDSAEAEINFQYSREMASRFQMHSDSAWQQTTPKLWHQFECQEYPFFVFDTRFQRRLIANGETALLDQEQATAFGRWLDDNRDAPVLFLVSGSPLAPLSKDIAGHPARASTDDSLLAYPRFLEQLLGLLSTVPAETPVVWLTGDPHFSCFADVNLCAGSQNRSVVQLCCSGLYAPMPFANANIHNYDWDQTVSVTLRHHGVEPVTISARQYLLSHSLQHFIRLDLQPQNSGFRLRMQAFDAQGRPCGPAWRTGGSIAEVEP
ncbi:GMC family oxidoreductase N-terminal domain-containing protein [Pseudohongiella sp. SYSU M77423]|uniref:GMC family oxidoreductase N-terminal domain-containing protein n=1 Tax=Pseudohongiella sp. SYSU M77423 TaxID=3042312 RepID=UPI0024818457|nr:GMC family oxidoreductase N-terminal domain-containing protein [Pseudohongiella sp. SYSU M77423]MDH7942739.1 GMC family oxidoreductase N-terminal domain-containing protein [Pseudohongiella sp. SYSU M77423]